MRIAVLGTGTVGPTIAGALSALGHDVVIGTRDPRATLARTGPGATGGPAVKGLLKGFGHRDIIDLGDITTARGAEMILPVWLRIWGALGTGVCSTSKSSAREADTI